MTDLNQADSQRNDGAILLLNLLGLAGLTVLVFVLLSDSGLWPSFSRERAYTSTTADFETPMPVSRPAPVFLPALQVEPVPSRIPRGAKEFDCPTRSRGQERVEATRRPTARRLSRLLSRRRTQPLLSNIVDG